MCIRDRGKTAVLDAVRAVGGDYEVRKEDFRESYPNVEILVTLQKNNGFIPKIFPHIYYMDVERNLEKFQDDLLLLQEDELLKQMRSGCCMFDMAKKCNHCFSCIGLIQKKTPEDLNCLLYTSRCV